MFSLYNALFGTPEPLLKIEHYDLHPTDYLQKGNLLNCLTINQDGSVDVDGENMGTLETGTVANYIKQYNMYNMSKRYGDSLTPQRSLEITMNTDSGTHFIHAEDSMPTLIKSFVREIMSYIENIPY